MYVAWLCFTRIVSATPVVSHPKCSLTPIRCKRFLNMSCMRLTFDGVRLHEAGIEIIPNQDWVNIHLGHCVAHE